MLSRVLLLEKRSEVASKAREEGEKTAKKEYHRLDLEDAALRKQITNAKHRMEDILKETKVFSNQEI